MTREDDDQGDYRSHHYVPQWYQKRFLEPSATANELHYLRLRPTIVRDARGRAHELPSCRRRSIRKCFAEDDLYTLRLKGVRSTVIEQLMFGDIDRRGASAVSYWTDFAHPSLDRAALDSLLLYMSTQKLRTPKGLDFLAQQVGTDRPSIVLRAMVELRTIFTSIWCECVWQIADATNSETKFIVSDHPVTVYNRECGPRNAKWCRGSNDPDIRLHGTHTIFPLSLDRVLILTNLSWARNPYQSATDWRPHPDYFHDTVFNVFDVQTHRTLTDEEVQQINFIIKSRAQAFVAAGREDWLFPERHVSKSDWNTYGQGYLLMPDPRGLHHGGEYYLGYADGSSEGFDVFGRRPWQQDFGQGDQPSVGPDGLFQFQGEFARRFGPFRRGRSFEVGKLAPERDSDEFHQYHLDLEHRRKR